MQDTTTQRCRLWRRHGKVYYAFDRQTGKQISLGTHDKTEALRLLDVRNEAEANPLLNRQIARAYLAASDPAMLTRTWRHALEELAKTQADENALRWAKVSNDKALGTLLDRPLIDTRPEHLLNVMQVGKVSTNVFLRRSLGYGVPAEGIHPQAAVVGLPGWKRSPILTRR